MRPHPRLAPNVFVPSSAATRPVWLARPSVMTEFGGVTGTGQQLTIRPQASAFNTKCSVSHHPKLQQTTTAARDTESNTRSPRIDTGDYSVVSMAEVSAILRPEMRDIRGEQLKLSLRTWQEKAKVRRATHQKTAIHEIQKISDTNLFYCSQSQPVAVAHDCTGATSISSSAVSSSAASFRSEPQTFVPRSFTVFTALSGLAVHPEPTPAISSTSLPAPSNTIRVFENSATFSTAVRPESAPASFFDPSNSAWSSDSTSPAQEYVATALSNPTVFKRMGHSSVFPVRRSPTRVAAVERSPNSMACLSNLPFAASAPSSTIVSSSISTPTLQQSSTTVSSASGEFQGPMSLDEIRRLKKQRVSERTEAPTSFSASTSTSITPSVASVTCTAAAISSVSLSAPRGVLPVERKSIQSRNVIPLVSDAECATAVASISRKPPMAPISHRSAVHTDSVNFGRKRNFPTTKAPFVIDPTATAERTALCDTSGVDKRITSPMLKHASNAMSEFRPLEQPEVSHRHDATITGETATNGYFFHWSNEECTAAIDFALAAHRKLRTANVAFDGISLTVPTAFGESTKTNMKTIEVARSEAAASSTGGLPLLGLFAGKPSTLSEFLDEDSFLSNLEPFVSKLKMKQKDLNDRLKDYKISLYKLFDASSESGIITF